MPFRCLCERQNRILTSDVELLGRRSTVVIHVSPPVPTEWFTGRPCSKSPAEKTLGPDGALHHVDLHVEFQITAGGKKFSVGLAAVRLLCNVPADVAFQLDCLNCFERLH